MNSTTTTAAVPVELEHSSRYPRKEDPRVRGRTCRCCTKSEFEPVPGPGIDYFKSYEIGKHCRTRSGHRSPIDGQDLNPEVRFVRTQHNTLSLGRNSGIPSYSRVVRHSRKPPRRTSHRLCARSNMIYWSHYRTISIVAITSRGSCSVQCESCVSVSLRRRSSARVLFRVWPCGVSKFN